MLLGRAAAACSSRVRMSSAPALEAHQFHALFGPLGLVVFLEEFADGFDAGLDDPQSFGKGPLHQKGRGHGPGVHHLHVWPPLVELEFNPIVAGMGPDKREQAELRRVSRAQSSYKSKCQKLR